jgi:hypothetical protein
MKLSAISFQPSEKKNKMKPQALACVLKRGGINKGQA